MTHFKNLNLPSDLLTNLNLLNYTEMTPIQQATLPHILDKKDIIAKAKTGSGKTLAFALPLALNIKAKQQHPQALIIAPTRELSEQIATEIKRVARYKSDVKVITLYGGTSLTRQVESLQKGADIIVGTPGRLLDHFSRESFELKDIKTLILDEADRMLDMGFADDILKLVSNLPKKRQTLLFSATYPDDISKLSEKVLDNPIKIELEGQEEQPLKIKEYAFEVSNKDKALITTLQSFQPNLAIIFCNTKVKTNEVGDMLHEKGFDVAVLNGDLEQYQRQEMLLQFANGSLPILVATDLASRGLDIESVELIINYDFPHKTEEYTHRIGRTGRAGADGIAVSICNEYEKNKIDEIRPTLQLNDIKELKINKNFYMQGEVGTLSIEGGKKKKLRAGDILGTLCKDIGLDVKDIGKINIFDTHSYVAINKNVIKKAFNGLKNGKIKKRKFRVWWL